MNNYVFTSSMLPLVQFIGLATKTIEYRVASSSIFCCLCLVIVIIPMLIDINMIEHWGVNLDKDQLSSTK